MARWRWLTAGLLCSGAIAAPDVPQFSPDPPTLWRELEPAWDVVAGKVTALVGLERQRQLIDLAYASVGANVCGFKLKSDAFQKAFGVFEDASDGQSEVRQQERKQHLLIHFGTFLGLLTAEALLSRDTFCSHAATVQAAGTGAGIYWGPQVVEH